MDSVPVGVWAALVGLVAGGILGLAARLGDFCTLGAIETARYGHNQTRLRQWALALGVATIGTFLVATYGPLDFSKTIYHSLRWNPLSSIVGGLIFGYGMAYAGNCGFGALARIGGAI